MKIKNTNKGITLIALVITIIVMLILVAVTITMAVNGGLFEYAGRAGTETNTKRDEEQEFANLDSDMTYDELINKYTSNTPGGNEGEKPEETGLQIGDYVNYPVEYTNVATWYDSDTGEEKGNYPRNEFTGWRVLSKETDDQGNVLYVKLISAGVPISYYHYNDSNTSVQTLTTNFLTTEITSTLTEYKFYKCGFKNVAGGTLENTFSNKFTDNVQALTKEDLDKAVVSLGGSTTTSGTYVTDSKYKDLFAVPCKGDESSEYALSWVSSPTNDFDLLRVHGVGVLAGAVGVVYGVRPVVSLKSGVQFTLATGYTNGTTTWDISI